MVLLQALLIASLGCLGSVYGTLLLGTVGGWNVIGRSIVAGALIGLILGSAKNGILIGTAMQVLYVGLVTPGISVLGDVNFAPHIGIPLALISSASPEYIVGISIPLSLLGVAAMYSVAIFNAVSVHLQDRRVKEGKLKQAVRVLIYPNISQFVVRFIPIFLACYFGAGYIPKMTALIPDQLGAIFRVLDDTLPAVGFALLIKSTLKESIELLYVLAGLTMMTVLKMPIMVITVPTAFIAYLNYPRCVK